MKKPGWTNYVKNEEVWRMVKDERNVFAYNKKKEGHLGLLDFP